jgi:hypothetical protein
VHVYTLLGENISESQHLDRDTLLRKKNAAIGLSYRMIPTSK